MEDAIIKLVKVTALKMKAMYQYGEDAESTVNNILSSAELAVHPQAKAELTEYFATLN